MTLILARVAPEPSVLAASVQNHPVWRGARIKTSKLFGELAVELVRAHAQDYLRSLLIEPLAVMLDDFTSANGTRPDIEGEEQADWDSALDDEVATILEPYAANVSAGWLGQATVETMLHLSGEIQKLAGSFASEAWKQLTYKRTTNQILAGIGLVHDILKQHVTDSEGPMELPNVNAILNKIMLTMPDEDDLTDNIDQASDTDDTLMQGACERLGIDVSEGLLLRVARAGGVDPEDWVQQIVAGELLDVTEAAPVAAAPAGPKTVPPPPAAGSGLVLETHVALGSVPPPPPPTPAGKPGRKPATASPPPAGYLSAGVLSTIKDAAGLKDEALGVLVGVSRPTLNNYLRGKGYCTPTPEQKASLLAKIEGKAVALQEAIAALRS